MLVKMWITEQDITLPVDNLCFIETDVSKTEENGKLLSNFVQAHFCDPSGCGKTSALLTFSIKTN